MTAELKTVRWRLRVMMAERGITTVTELGRRLQRVGLTMSSQQLTRIASEKPQRLNMQLLEGLLTVLNCRPEDLFQIQEPAASASPPGKEASAAPAEAGRRSRSARGPRKRKARQPVPAEPIDEIAGPVVTPFPIQSRR